MTIPAHLNKPPHRLADGELDELEKNCQDWIDSDANDGRTSVGSSNEFDVRGGIIEDVRQERQRRADLSSKTDMIERWADTRDHRNGLESFLEWLVQVEKTTKMIDLHTDHILDQYFGIDQRQLDRERTALLEAHDPG